jgi:hypothetical protein
MQHEEILWACVILGAATRYMLAMSQGCLFIGRAISTDDSKTGFQDAITPPWSTRLTLGIYALSVALTVFAFWLGGPSFAGVIAFALIAFVFFSGYVIPKPNSGHWVRLVYRSMVNRTADYAKAGDTTRADAASTLTRRIAEHFQGALKQ